MCKLTNLKSLIEQEINLKKLDLVFSARHIRVKISLNFFTECDCLFIKEDTEQINCKDAIKRSWTKYSGHLFMKRA